ncbi:MAG: FAD-dependent monooxygenase, partial [Gammaproteobacteria bacterium]|nr:FAD-dependent monooxygenase [Gammaproteobacteria bacterium]
SIVWSADDARAEALMAMDDASFARELGAAFGHRLGGIVSVSPRAAFPLAGSQAAAYVRPRIALVGDAAHTIHPLAGQGANLGFLDAAALADVLAGVPAGGDLGHHALLRRYERARRGDNVLTMRAMEGFKLLFGNDLAPLSWLRNTGLALTNRAGPVKHELIRRAMGLSGERPTLAR